MKLLKILIVTLFVTSSAFAQGLPIRNDTPSNLRDLGSNLNVGHNYAVDQKGRILIAPSASVGIYVEDTPFPDGGSVQMSGGVNIRTFTAFNSTNLDVTPIGVGDKGVVAVMPMYDSSLAGANTTIALEDTTATTGDATFRISNKRLDQLATGEVDANLDYAIPILDTLSRLYINPWGAAVTEFYQSCGTATAVTSDVAIKASVASNRIYVTSIDCKNTSTTVGPTLDFKDNTTIIAVGGISATSATGVLSGEYHVTFPIPLRGTSATAFNFATNTATSSVTCCAKGFISPY